MAHNEEGILTMCLTNGLFIVGKLLGGGQKLLQPRVFDMYPEQVMTPSGKPVIDEEGKPKMQDIIRLRPLPGVPRFMYLGTEASKYPIDGNMMNIATLYKKVTEVERTNIVVPPDFRNPNIPPGMEMN